MCQLKTQLIAYSWADVSIQLISEQSFQLIPKFRESRNAAFETGLINAAGRSGDVPVFKLFPCNNILPHLSRPSRVSKKQNNNKQNYNKQNAWLKLRVAVGLLLCRPLLMLQLYCRMYCPFFFESVFGTTAIFGTGTFFSIFYSSTKVSNLGSLTSERIKKEKSP